MKKSEPESASEIKVVTTPIELLRDCASGSNELLCGFEEWYAKDEEDFYNFEKESARACWNAAIDEAVKVALTAAKHKKDVDNLVGEVVAENIADNLKELK